MRRIRAKKLEPPRAHLGSGVGRRYRPARGRWHGRPGGHRRPLAARRVERAHAGPGRAQAGAVRTGRDAARSVLRRRRTARAYTPPHQGPGAPVDEPLLLAEEHRQVLDALAHLTARQREVLVLRYWSELTEAQIAETLGVSRGTVKSTASRALGTPEKLLEADR